MNIKSAQILAQLSKDLNLKVPVLAKSNKVLQTALWNIYIKSKVSMERDS